MFVLSLDQSEWAHLTVLKFSAIEPGHLEPEQLIDLVAENAGLRAALALAEGASVQRELVSQELKHRIGNLVAVVQAIARKTFRDADQTCLTDFHARLSALAAAQAVLIDAETKPALLLDVAKRALAPHISSAERLAISGSEVALSGRHAHALTLALHELATNAAKYGALSVDGGAVEIHWTSTNEELHFLWRERGGPTVSAPTKNGFGSALITANLSTAFSGVVELLFERDGVQCQLRAPLPLAL
ncbi:MAG: sensor histidine kinase [Pseudomonadota bacterium]